ncbi:hypothetical protein ACFL14_02340 [Patescibacteria group bacterium]
MKKYIIFLLAVFTAFLFNINPDPINAAASLSLSPDSQGSVGTELTIKAERFCLDNTGFPVTVMWDGAPIDVGTAPSFEIKYTIPADTTKGSHTILVIANCPGQPPTIPASIDQATTTFTVVSESENNDDSEEDKQATTTVTDNESKDENNKNEKDKNSSDAWYSNWVYLGLLGLGLILLIVGIVLIVRFEKNKPDKVNIKSDINKPSEKKEIISKPQPKTIQKSSILKRSNKADTPKPVKSRVEYEE